MMMWKLIPGLFCALMATQSAKAIEESPEAHPLTQRRLQPAWGSRSIDRRYNDPPIGDQSSTIDPNSTIDPKTTNDLKTTSDPATNLPIKYWGNSFSLKFHRPSCPFAKAMSADHVMFFNFRREAVDSGQVPCRYCLPPNWTTVRATIMPKAKTTQQEVEMPTKGDVR